MYVFLAHADEIHAWGGVPAKNEQFHGGFQRALDKRYEKITSFFDKGQASPGAIVVAFRQGVLRTTPLGMPDAWATGALRSEGAFAFLSFDWDESLDSASLDILRLKAVEVLRNRAGLEDDESTDTDDTTDSDQDDSEQQESDDSVSEITDDFDTDELDVGQSKLRAFYDFLNNPEKVDDWLNRQNSRFDDIRNKSKPTKTEREYLRMTPETRLCETLKALLRPAMIVDGQHRVMGAHESDKDPIQFAVCALKDADWIEQVFQFVVLNKMARPISKDFLTELLNTSLTNAEIGEIDKRLETIGIRNADRRIHKLLNHDERSPFRELIAEAGEVADIISRQGKLSQQGMLRVAKRWRIISSTKRKSELAMFYPILGTDKVGEARVKWEENDKWVEFFFAFWSKMKEIYEPGQVWDKSPGFNLLYIVTLMALQDLFITSKARGDVTFDSLDDFAAQVQRFFNNVPASFFQDWAATGLQSGDGPQTIKNAVGELRNGTALSTVKSNSPLFNS